MEAIQSNKMNWLLDIAEKIKSHFSRESNEAYDIIKSVAKEHDALIAFNCVASNEYAFFIVTKTPHQLLVDIIDNFKRVNSKHLQQNLNPISIVNKLINREYILDLNGYKTCYVIQSNIPSNYLLKTITCRIIANIKYYKNFVDKDSGAIDMNKIQELHPLYDYNTNSQKILGGRKQTYTNRGKQKGQIKIQILLRLIDYIRSNKSIANGLIFINNIDECSAVAMNIFYTECKYKTAVMDYLRLLITDLYKDYTFKSFQHGDFIIPYDYRMTKHGCVMVDNITKDTIYLVSLYNSATYEPIPCIRSNTGELIAHPIVKLRMVYIDMYLIEVKIGVGKSVNFERLQKNRMMSIFNNLETYDKFPSWIGYFIDETYEKMRHNAKLTNMANPITQYFI